MEVSFGKLMHIELVAVIDETRKVYRILTKDVFIWRKIWSFTKIWKDNIKIDFRDNYSWNLYYFYFFDLNKTSWRWHFAAETCRKLLFLISFILLSAFLVGISVLRNQFNLLAKEFCFLILAHPVCKMWIIQAPKRVALWNKRHFEEKKTESLQNV
jgi:hypothetical protein